MKYPLYACASFALAVIACGLRVNALDFIFVHNYKAMGTTVYDQLPREHRERLYGIRSYASLGLPEPETPSKKKVSLDHVPLDTLVDWGVLRNDEVHLPCIGIVRRPIEWFVSMANFRRATLNQTMAHIAKRTRQPDKVQFSGLPQHHAFKSHRPFNITLFAMEDTSGISAWFAQHGARVTFAKKRNATPPKMRESSVNSLTTAHLAFVRRCLARDAVLHERLIAGGPWHAYTSAEFARLTAHLPADATACTVGPVVPATAGWQSCDPVDMDTRPTYNRVSCQTGFY